MEELKNEELKQIDGGFALGLEGITLIAFGVPFAIGLIQGLVFPSLNS